MYQYKQTGIGEGADQWIPGGPFSYGGYSMAVVPVVASKRKYQDAFQRKGGAKGGDSSKDGVPDPYFWGPYLAERQWGTIREDYSSDGSSWSYMSYEKAVEHAYAWGEDGLLGISDKFGLLCASLALWNGKDPLLKERLFGLTGKEGNHGEDVKELYYYLDNMPNHNYMRALYKYPHKTFPYETLVKHGMTARDPELEIVDTGVFDDNAFWEITVEYAKPAFHCMVCKYTALNRSSQTATLHIIPQFVFRNTWRKPGFTSSKIVAPHFQYIDTNAVDAIYDAGIFRINVLKSANVTFHDLLFTDNETATEEVPGQKAGGMEEDLEIGQKDAFHKYIIHDDISAVKDCRLGTKMGALLSAELPGNGICTVYWTINPGHMVGETNISKLDLLIKTQKSKAHEFYQNVIPKGLSTYHYDACRQAIAGLLWSKQYYSYNMDIKNSELMALYDENYFMSPQGQKKLGWDHLTCHDILLMPDTWEFPWFAAWDLAFHCVQFARLDLQFAMEQLVLILSDRYMHPNGQIPGCEFDFGDPNPPIIAWAVWKVYETGAKKDKVFLKTCFNRLIFSFQWWHTMDSEASYVYGHGFMGLDNISVFDRSELPSEVKSLKQADATGWMGLFALNMLQISLELGLYDSSYTDMAIKFLRHFLFISRAMNRSVADGGLWLDSDKFYYDAVQLHNTKTPVPIKLRSWTGIVPMLACGVISLKNLPLVRTFLLKCDRSFAPFVCKLDENDFFLTLVSYPRLKSMLHTIFNEDEFLSPFGIRSMSKVYEESPYQIDIGGETYSASYRPGESSSDMFGGNSNWRGPIWLCMNFLFVECMETYAELNRVFTLPLAIDYPTGHSEGKRITFPAIALDLCQRIVSLFTPNAAGTRPVDGVNEGHSSGDESHTLIQFYEYFNAETGRGCGASHQTGWSALYVEFLHKIATFKVNKKPR